jgi:hypothetical protein
MGGAARCQPKASSSFAASCLLTQLTVALCIVFLQWQHPTQPTYLFRALPCTTSRLSARSDQKRTNARACPRRKPPTQAHHDHQLSGHDCPSMYGTFECVFTSQTWIIPICTCLSIRHASDAFGPCPSTSFWIATMSRLHTNVRSYRRDPHYHIGNAIQPTSRETNHGRFRERHDAFDGCGHG